MIRLLVFLQKQAHFLLLFDDRIAIFIIILNNYKKEKETKKLFQKSS